MALRSESNHLEEERLVLESSTLKMEGERDALESAIHRSEVESSRFKREKQLLEDEQQLLKQEKEGLREESEISFGASRMRAASLHSLAVIKIQEPLSKFSPICRISSHSLSVSRSKCYPM